MKVAVAVCPMLPVAVTVKRYLPARTGLPVTRPVTVRRIPFGSVPALTCQVAAESARRRRS